MAGSITASAFNELGPYFSSPGIKPTSCYAELALSSLALAKAVTIASTHFA